MSGIGGLRHIYTATEPSEPDGHSGFQTIAYTKGLENLVPAIVQLVQGFSAPNGDEPRCRQLAQVPGFDAYALTTLTPTGRMPDDRHGNFHAETIVVPETWLAAAQWDAAAAFEALGWLGPGGALQDDRPFALPNLEPGPVERLEVVKRVVPAPRLAPLLKAVIHQTNGLRPLRVLAGPETSQEDLEQLIMVLPLVVHPALRGIYRVEGRQRCLTLRTTSPIRAMLPAMDIVGFPAAAAESLAMEGSVVFDLGSHLAIPRSRGKGGDAYVRWLSQVMQEGAWDELEAVYRAEGPSSAKQWFASFRHKQAPSPPPSGHPATAETRGPRPLGNEPGDQLSLMAQQEEAWARRDEVESTAQIAFDASKDTLQDQLDLYQQSLNAAVNKLSEAVRTDTASFRSRVDRATADAEQRHLRLERSLADRVAALEDAVRSLQTGQQHRQPLPGQAAPPRVVTAAPDDPHHELGGTGTAYSVQQRGWWENTLDWIYASLPGGSSIAHHPLARWLPVALALAVIALGILWFNRSPTETDPIDEPQAALEAEAAKERRAERRRSLVQRFEDPALSSALLATVQAEPVDEGSQPFIRLARTLALAVNLGRVPITEAGQIAILQQALATGVDGGWGAGSRGKLAAQLGDCTECLPQASQDLPAEELAKQTQQLSWNSPAANCVLRAHIGLSQERCSATSVWSPDYSWTGTEAAGAASLIKATADQANQRLEEELARFDLQQGAISENLMPNLEAIGPHHAKALADLAYSWTEQKVGASLPENPTDGQFEQLEKLVESMTAGGADS
ncbi:MAG: hypothetical protein AAF560_19415 [Acidobacteriota bacterium]